MGIEDLANMDAVIPGSEGEGEPTAKPPPPEPKPGEKGVAPIAGDTDDEEAPRKPPKKKPDEAADDTEGGEEGDDAEPAPEYKVKGTEKTTVKLEDGTEQEVTIDELKKGYMRQSHFSRKRGEDAQKARELEQKQATFEADQQRDKRFWQRLKNDAVFLREVLEEHAGETYRRAVEATADEMYELSQMPEGERAARIENRELKRAKDKNDREKKAREASQQTAQRTAHQKEMDGKYSEWVPAAMKEAAILVEGDEEHNKEMRGLLIARIQSDHGTGRDYTREEINASAAAVAASRAGQALMGQNGQIDPVELEKRLGPEATKKFLAFQAEKVRGGKAPPAPAGNRPPAPKKKKEPGDLGFLARLRDDLEV